MMMLLFYLGNYTPFQKRKHKFRTIQVSFFTFDVFAVDITAFLVLS